MPRKELSDTFKTKTTYWHFLGQFQVVNMNMSIRVALKPSTSQPVFQSKSSPGMYWEIKKLIFRKKYRKL